MRSPLLPYSPPFTSRPPLHPASPAPRRPVQISTSCSAAGSPPLLHHVWSSPPPPLPRAPLPSAPPLSTCAYTSAHRGRIRQRRVSACADLTSADDAECSTDKLCIYFVTGNRRKEQEVNAILAAERFFPFRVQHIDLDLPEMQGEPMDIARAKVAAAAAHVGCSVLVEDTSLCMSALNGMPGPYIKWFVDCVGVAGLYRLLDGHADKSAYCQCIVGFCSGPGAEPRLFVGRTPGTIRPPQGTGGFGWDAVFVPDGFEEPFSAMPMVQKNRISHRGKALQQFVAYRKANEGHITSSAQAIALAQGEGAPGA